MQSVTTRIAAALGALALVMLGSIVVAAPASAASTAQFSIVDSADQPLPGVEFRAVNLDDDSTAEATSDGTGTLSFSGLTDGAYNLELIPTYRFGLAYTPATFYLTGDAHVDSDPITVFENGKIVGTLPADGIDTVIRLLTPVASYFTEVDSSDDGDSTISIDPVSGDFVVYLPTNANYTLHFTPSEASPYLPTHLGSPYPAYEVGNGVSDWRQRGGAGDVWDVNYTETNITLVRAVTVEGAVSLPNGDPAVGAEVELLDNYGSPTGFPATTDSSGDYRVKGDNTNSDNFSIRASLDGYQTTEAVESNGDRRILTLTDSDPDIVDVDFALLYEGLDITGDYEDWLPDDLDTNPIVYLFLGEDRVPIDYDFADFDFLNLQPGEYSLGFRDRDDEGWIPWKSLNDGGTVTSTPSTECRYEIELTAGGASVQLDDVRVDPEASCDHPLEGAPSGEVSGTVTNRAATGPLTAYLYYLDTYEIFEVDSAPVDADGDYVLDGVTRDGEYTVVIEAPDDIPYFTTGLGDVLMDECGCGIDDADVLELEADEDSSGNDVTMVGARIFGGTVTAGGAGVEGVEVVAYDPVGPGTFYASTAPDGSYVLKVAVGTSYVLIANVPSYQPLYYNGVSEEEDATLLNASSIGTDPTSYDFTLPSVLGLVFPFAADDPYADLVDLEGGTVHVFQKLGGVWQETDVVPTEDAPSGSMFPPGTDLFVLPTASSATVPGTEYRIWFAKDGAWLPVYSYTYLSPSGGYGDEHDEGYCYVESPDLDESPLQLLFVGLDIGGTAGCNPAVENVDDPATPPGPGTTDPDPGTTPRSPTGIPRNSLVVDGPTPSPTPSATASPTPRPTPSSTPAPDATAAPEADGGSDASAPDLGWLIWLIVGAGVIVLGGVAFLIFRPRV